jgi:hypothetical protein
MTPRELEEYSALRATIRERGTARVWVFVAGFAVWSGLAVATAALATLPIATLLPLLMLAAVFETVFSLHTAVERVGRYIQVFYEEPSERNWEHTAMAFGRGIRRGGTDPLFAAYFWMAAGLNLIPAALADPVAIEWTVLGTAHGLFVVHVFLARRRAAAQRAADLERFEQLRKDHQGETTRTSSA